MTFYIYKMKGINYIGSCGDIKLRTQQHKTKCYKENSRAYNYLVYQYIREKQIDIELEILGVYKKECSYRIKLLVEQFYINKYNSVNNGLNTINAFRTEKNKKKYGIEWRKKNRNYLLKQKKIYYENNKKKHSQTCKIYYENNKDKIKQKTREWCINNREKRNKSSRKSYQKNKYKRSIKINCPKCDSLIRKDSLKTHQKSKKCKKLSTLKISDERV